MKFRSETNRKGVRRRHKQQAEKLIFISFGKSVIILRVISHVAYVHALLH